MCLHKIVPFLLLLTLIPAHESQDTSAKTPSEPAVYMVVFRTPAHVRHSSPQVFHGFTHDLWSYLREKNVPLKVDPERGTIETESEMSVGSMLNIAKQAGATSLLFVTVDRPFSKWIKVTVQSYDLDGKLMWSEQASDAGSMTGKGGYKKTLERLQTSLARRLGGPGLPVRAGEMSTPAPSEGVVKP